MAEYTPHLPRFNHHAKALQTNCEDKLLPQQHTALNKIRAHFAAPDGRRIGVISMPTGSGKTGIMCCLPYYLADVCLFDKPVLVIAPDLVITEQIEQEMFSGTAATLPFLKRRGIVPEDRHDVLPTGTRIEEAKQLNNEHLIRNPDLIIANAQKFLGQGWREALPDYTFRLVMVDEAHHHPAKTWRDIVDAFRGHALVVFFTATPYRADRQMVLEPLYIIYRLPLAEAIQQRIIRRTNFEEMEVTDPLQGVQLQNPNDELARIAPILRKVQELQASKDRDTPLPEGVPHMAMVIAKDTTAAEDIVELWSALFPGNPASAYHSNMEKYELKRAMEKIRSNKLKLVVVVAMLQEGFDHPPVSIVGVATKISSPVKFVQFIGRAQRVCRDSHGNLENPEIAAHIISHEVYQQKRNYNKFIRETLIPDG